MRAIPRFRLCGSAGALLCALAAGCNTADLDMGFRKLFEPQRTPQQNMVIAVSDPDPDVRRDAAAKLAASGQITQEWAVNGLTAIALLEVNPQTRCVAIRGLAAGRDPRAVDAMLKILNHTRHPLREVRAPGELVRWDAALALAELSEARVVTVEQADAVRETLLERLRNDPDRHVRIAAARGLACCPQRDAVDGLIRALADDDFAVVAAATRSLERLTGARLGSDAQAWSQWLTEHPSPELSVRPPPARRTWWQRMGQGTRDLFGWLFPGPKAR
jgi:HEAT repeat protein